jgi:hypothetical protein
LCVLTILYIVYFNYKIYTIKYNFYIYQEATFGSSSKLNLQVFYFEHICIQKLSLEREVDQMVNDMMEKEGWTRSYALSVLRSKFESEQRHQEVSYVDDLIQKEAEEEEEEEELVPTSTTATNTEDEEVATITNEPEVTTTKTSKVTPSTAQQQKEGQETMSSKQSISKQLDKQTIQINKKITQIFKPIQKHIKSVDRQSELIKQIQSQLKQLQKQVSQIQKVVSIGKKKKKKR